MRLSAKRECTIVTGYRRLLVLAFLQRLTRGGYDSLLVRTRQELNLPDQTALNRFFDASCLEILVFAAARVDSILANGTHPADFVGNNFALQTRVLQAAQIAGGKRLLLLGSICLYGREAPQPLKENHQCIRPLKPPTEWNAAARIEGTRNCLALRKQHECDSDSLVLANFCGPASSSDLETSRMLPVPIGNVHQAMCNGTRYTTVEGTGMPRREYLCSKETEDACLLVLQQPNEMLFQAAPDGIQKVDMGRDMATGAQADISRAVVGTMCTAWYDSSKPDSTPGRLVDVSHRRHLGWQVPTSPEDGIGQT